MDNGNDRVREWISPERLEFLKQCPKPSGKIGRKVGEEMNIHHRELRDWGFSYIKFDPEYTVLDAGCGGGDTISRLVALCPKGKIYGIDYSDEMVSLASENNAKAIRNGDVKIQNASVSSLPFSDSFFDMVTALETTYFWPDLNAALREIHRVMKKNAVFTMINETYMNEIFRDDIEELHRLIDLKVYTPEEYESFFSKAGFSDIKIHTVEEKNWLALSAVK